MSVPETPLVDIPTDLPGLLPLETARLKLRLLTDADIPAIFAIHSHPEVMRYWSSPPMTDIAQAADLIARIQRSYAAGTHWQLGLERHVEGDLIGTCTLFQWDSQCRRAEIGYVLGRPFWGAGYMSEALTALIACVFGPLGLNRLEADIDPRNAASARILERLGFQREGLLRERWIVGREISDTALYGLLARDWADVHPKKDRSH